MQQRRPFAVGGQPCLVGCPMLFSRLISALPDATPSGVLDREITAVVYQSWRVERGALFVAVPGFRVDGHQFAADARERGAAAVVVERGRIARPHDWDSSRCAWIETADTRLALSALAARWFGNPAEQMTVIGITGTDGKTTTSYMTAALLDGAGFTSGLMSTVQVKAGSRWQTNASRQTTQEATDVHELLAWMRDAGVSHAVIESSSHGLALRKLDHCAFDAAIVTNVVADHLDFHRTREAYLAAKARLLELTGRAASKPGPGVVVLNADDRSHGELRPLVRGEVITFGLEREADLRGEVREATASGSRVRLTGRLGTADLRLPVPGGFNVSNALAAIACATGLGVPLGVAAGALAGFSGVPGRMQRVDAGQPFTVIVDYAHTGHSFRKLLQVLRPLTSGRLITVFGSAGEQSHERRIGMGEVASELADFSVLTNEDPRQEHPDAVIGGIARAMLAQGSVEGRDFVRVTDRRQAIRTAFAHARTGDLVVLAGKGHEQSIIVGDEKLPWDERDAAVLCLAELGYRKPLADGAGTTFGQGA